MRRIALYLLINFTPYFFCAQISAVNDANNNEFTVRFDKIKSNAEDFNSVEMKVSHLEGSNNVQLHFTVPNYFLRYKTTLSDKVIIKTNNETVALENLVESDVEEGSICRTYVLAQNYIFTCSISKDLFNKIIKDNSITLTFYFAPNENFIIKRLEQEKFMHRDIFHFIKVQANNAVRYVASQPDLIQYNKLSEWLAQLK